jgi:hypothetical protein
VACDSEPWHFGATAARRREACGARVPGGVVLEHGAQDARCAACVGASATARCCQRQGVAWRLRRLVRSANVTDGRSQRLVATAASLPPACARRTLKRQPERGADGARRRRCPRESAAPTRLRCPDGTRSPPAAPLWTPKKPPPPRGGASWAAGGKSARPAARRSGSITARPARPAAPQDWPPSPPRRGRRLARGDAPLAGAQRVLERRERGYILPDPRIGPTLESIGDQPFSRPPSL